MAFAKLRSSDAEMRWSVRISWIIATYRDHRRVSDSSGLLPRQRASAVKSECVAMPCRRGFQCGDITSRR